MSMSAKEHAYSAAVAVEPRGGQALAGHPSGKRIIWSAYIGSVVEWFDFFIYSIASASVFNVLFFPNESKSVGTLLALGTLAIGYVVRPLGGIIYGHFGDRIGRKKMLVSSIVLMGAATIAIGLLPTYAQIGFMAPVLLLLLRIIQGFAVAGEWGGALLMTIEHAGKGRRGLWSCVIGMGQCSGLLLGTLVFSLISRMPEAAFLSWGWRTPFLGAVLLIGLGLWMRLGIEESPVFVAQQKKREAAGPEVNRTPPIVDVLRNGWRQLLQACGIVSGPFVVSALISPFCIAYAIQLGFERSTALNAASVAALCQIIGMVIGGALSDKVGRRPVFMVGAVLMAVNMYAMFTLANMKVTDMLVLGFALGGLSHGFMFGPIGAFIAELFSTGSRFTGASLGYQVAGTFGGGFAPLIASSLLILGGGAPNVQYVLVFAFVMCLVSFIVALKSRETYLDDLNKSA